MNANFKHKSMFGLEISSAEVTNIKCINLSFLNLLPYNLFLLNSHSSRHFLIATILFY